MGGCSKGVMCHHTDCPQAQSPGQVPRGTWYSMDKAWPPDPDTGPVRTQVVKETEGTWETMEHVSCSPVHSHSGHTGGWQGDIEAS